MLSWPSQPHVQVPGVTHYPNASYRAANATTSNVESSFLINSFAAQLSPADLAVMQSFTAKAPVSQGKVVTGMDL